jgi:hypothetical protein
VDFTGIDAAIAAGDRPAILFDRYLAGEFNETKDGPPIGARVAIVEGRFDNWLATVTDLEKGGKFSAKLPGHKTTLNKLPGRALRPAFGSDLERSNPEKVPM